VPQIPADEKFEYIIVGLGGNDVLKLSSPLKWRRNMIKVLSALRAAHPESVIFIHNVAGVKRSAARKLKPVRARVTGDRDADVDATVGRFPAALERTVRRHPDQHFWHHRRWKPHPPDTPPALRGPRYALR